MLKANFALHWRRPLLILLFTAVAAGCGSNDEDEDPDNGGGTPTPPVRGELVQSPPVLVTTLSAGTLLADPNDPLQQALLLQAGTPVCDIAVHRIEYRSVGGADESTKSTGALMVPTGTDAKCKGARPIVLYAHGTTTDIDYDLTNLENEDNAEGLFLAAYFAAQGYIVVAPNYAGYTGSMLGYHPYLNGDQQSKDMIDALKAARSALPSSAAQGTTDGGKLYVTGYSQGGYVALATERALEAAGTRVDAAVPMSGPYALSAFADAIFAGRVNGGAPIFTTMMLTAYQKSYGNVYGSVNDVYSPPYVDGIEALLPSTRLRSEIYDAGDLPPNALFNSEPPDPAYADITPATEPENLAQVFERGFDDEHLLKNSFRLTYLQDRDANPDGWWPEPTTNEPPATPGMPFRQAIKRNDLRTWTPATPTLLCGGHDDPVVFWMNTEAMQDYWETHGSASAPFTVLDVDAATSGNDDPYEDVKRGFSIAKDVLRAAAVAQGATDGGDEAVSDAYHAGLVAPFCIEAARNFFEEH